MKLISRHEVPIKTVSEANERGGHWKPAWARGKRQKEELIEWFSGPRRKDIDQVRPDPHINLIRVSPRKLDSDNLISAFKAVRDQLAALIKPGYAPGRADDDGDITWSYDQQAGKPQGIIIEFYKKVDL